MNSINHQLEALLSRPSLTEEEKQLLLSYLQEGDNPEVLELLLTKFADDLAKAPASETLSKETAKQIFQAALSNTIPSATPNSISISSHKRTWFAAAAIIFVLIFSAIWVLRPSENLTKTDVTKTQPANDVAAPDASIPTIVLANGKKITLDSNYKGMLASEGGVQIERDADGTITYQGVESADRYNTLINPRGSKPVSLTLSDGSKVWLNSESSLRYPVFFTGQSRLVEVNGEAYFEVAKNPTKPFRVTIGGKGTVEVLGTHFNINSYSNEAHTHITLLEGRVRIISPASESVVLQPGQQASYSNIENNHATISVKNQVNLEAVVAWKNGYFNFQHADLYTVMRQLARWYDIDIQYEGSLPARYFGGEMQRDLNLSEVLKLLEKNNVHFTIENRKLIVKP